MPPTLGSIFPFQPFCGFPSLLHCVIQERHCHVTAGINSVVFYAPVIFSSLGMGQNSSLLSSVIIGVVFVVTTVVAVLTVDKFGRKVRRNPLPCSF